MILQALTELYEQLAAKGVLAGAGWSPVKVSYALYLNDAGEITQVASLKVEQTKGKKTVLVPQSVSLPAPVKRTVGVAANFLCDNSSYMLGMDQKGKPERTKECFNACKQLHQTILTDVDSPAARAVLAFFERWEPGEEQTCPALAEVMDDILAGANLIFRYAGSYLHEDPQIRQAWERYYNQSSGQGREMVCLVTGQRGPVESVHPAIKNVTGAQSSGAALVSFNAPAFCSYGKEQNYNAPTSQHAAFAYTAALNHLLADWERVCHIGDATVVFWAKSGETDYSDFFMDSLFDQERKYEPEELQAMMASLSKGEAVTYDQNQLDPNMQFYVLGLSPNAARLSVRFFLQNSFGNLVANAKAHQERLEIVRPSFDKFVTMPLWALLRETVNENSRDKAPAPNLAGEVLRSILNNTPYPATLLQGVQLRIRAERRVTRGRAAIIKAYYLKKPHPEVPEEVLTVALNRESNNVPYTLGRLFSVLEAIQEAANPGINATIQDRYFNSASSTPARVFPTLLNLSQKHLKKLSGGLRITYERQVTELLGKLPESFPAQFSLPQQGSFQLGYYHQTQARYEKREEN